MMLLSTESVLCFRFGSVISLLIEDTRYFCFFTSALERKFQEKALRLFAWKLGDC
jgi:hypothetical protein